MRYMSRVASAFLLVLAALPALHAQAVRGTLVNNTGQPASGAVVMLIDSTSSVAARAISNANGEFRLRATTAGTYQLYVLRLGYRPSLTESFALHTGEELARRFVLMGTPFSLDTLRVVSNALCRNADSTQQAFNVWEQVRAGLAATDISARDRAVYARVVSYDRALDRSGQRVIRQDARLQSSLVRSHGCPRV